MTYYKLDRTYFPNKTDYYKALFKKYLSFIIPFYIKTPSIFQISNDKQIAIEKVGYLFGWHWKKWKWAKLTGRIFKRVPGEPVTPEQIQDHYALTGNTLVRANPENIIVYATEDFMPYEFEPYMVVKLRP